MNFSCFDDHRVEENPPADFAKWDRVALLLVAKPTKAGPAGFIEKDFEEFDGVDVACRWTALVLLLRYYFIHSINLCGQLV